MPDLTKRESCLFMISCIVAMISIVLILWGLSTLQESCWAQYQDEQTAIQNCETKP